MKSFLRLISRLFHDLLVQYKLWKPIRQARFVFLIHPRDERDVVQHFSFFQHLPLFFLRWILWHIWPLRIHKVIVKNHQENFFGWTIAVPLTAFMMLSNRDRARKKIQDAVRLGEGLGARIIGLGALVPSMTNGGAELVSSKHTYITNGYTTTVFFIARTVQKLIEDFALDPQKLVVGIVGAAGSVGSASTLLLLKRYRFARVFLFDLERKKDKLFVLRTEVVQTTDVPVEICYTLDRTSETHILITATNTAEFVLHTKHLAPGTFVVDDAQPSDVDPEVIHRRKDVVVLEAAIVHSDMVTVIHNKELLDEHDLFSCLAESVLLALQNFTVDLSSRRMIVDTEELMRGTDFRVAEYQNFLGEASREQLEYVARLLKQRYGF